MKEGGKAPKAVKVSGEGLGAWDPMPAVAVAPVSDWFFDFPCLLLGDGSA